MKRCPYCNSEISDTTIKCRYCKQRIIAGGQADMKVISGKGFKKWLILILFFIIAITGSLIYLKTDSHEKYYINRTYGIKIWHPKEWKVFDLSTYHDIFKVLSRAARPEGADMRLICAFSCTKNLRNLDPLITVCVQPIADNLKDLSAEELAGFIDHELRPSSLSSKSSIKEYPTVITISGKKFVRYIGNFTARGTEWENVYYYFIKGAKLYMVNLTTKTDVIDKYRKVYDDMAGSIRILERRR